MREIKFRQFKDGAFKEFGCFEDGVFICPDSSIFSRYPPMQFTGLQDCNGVDIYEGDIVSEPISPVGGVDGGYLYESRVIEWHGASCGYKLFAPHAASKVIGNIYQNPEMVPC